MWKNNSVNMNYSYPFAFNKGFNFFFFTLFSSFFEEDMYFLRYSNLLKGAVILFWTKYLQNVQLPSSLEFHKQRPPYVENGAICF